MSMKVNKNGKGYPVGVIPQSLYDDVEDLKDGKVDKSGDIMTGDLVSRAHIKSDRQNGTTIQVGDSYVMIGNDIPSGTDKNSKGYLRLYSQGTKYINLATAPSITDNRTIYLPNKSGTLALTANGVQLGNTNAYLYRVGNLRVFMAQADASKIASITIPVGDRPSSARVFPIPWYGSLGRVTIETDGSISIGHYATYGNQTITDDSSSTFTLKCSLVWGVDE